MEKQCCSICNCHKNNPCHNSDYPHNHNSCKHCRPNECCYASHCNRCRKDLCASNFSVRLSGLQNGLSFRLRQLIGSLVEFEFDNGKKVKGSIVFVGSNFVELYVDDTHPIGREDEKELFTEEQLDKESIYEIHKEESILDNSTENRKPIKNRIWIFSIDKILHMIVPSSCPLKNTCP